eukprot:TRINITY_DN8353_c0_g1_i5.p1 TRINITY_DN8353_c0_g1~~TRINITY_DN8353_c0_g1_i5.p1  ORF type:complete len:604 (+),score=110.31 TRINITY_DN8353_c0_g1_i5:113-1924(+)
MAALGGLESLAAPAVRAQAPGSLLAGLRRHPSLESHPRRQQRPCWRRAAVPPQPLLDQGGFDDHDQDSLTELLGLGSRPASNQAAHAGRGAAMGAPGAAQVARGLGNGRSGSREASLVREPSGASPGGARPPRARANIPGAESGAVPGLGSRSSAPARQDSGPAAGAARLLFSSGPANAPPCGSGGSATSSASGAAARGGGVLSPSMSAAPAPALSMGAAAMLAPPQPGAGAPGHGVDRGAGASALLIPTPTSADEPNPLGLSALLDDLRGDLRCALASSSKNEPSSATAVAGVPALSSFGGAAAHHPVGAAAAGASPAPMCSWGAHRPPETAAMVSVAEDPNEGFRPYMEDGHKIVDPLLQCGVQGREDNWGLFAVYDGHGGRKEVEYVEGKLHDIVLAELQAQGPTKDAAAALTAAFKKVDSQLAMLGAWNSGCTATVSLVRRQAERTTVYVANVGDSRAVIVGLGSSRPTERLSTDHRATDASEAQRIAEEGGIVRHGRVGGALSVSRSLGDHSLKGSGVSCVPDVQTYTAEPGQALVIASDGLWDALQDDDARQVLSSSLESCTLPLSSLHGERAARSLVEAAKERGSRDNILALVVFL